MNAATKRLNALRELLGNARECLGLDVGFLLWDGSTLPTGLPPDVLAIYFADEGVIAALIRRPRIQTLANLWVTGRVDIRNGTLFDLARMRPRVRSKQFFKALDKRLLATTVLRFLLVPIGGPWPLNNQPRQQRSNYPPDKNKKNIAYHYDISNAFYALFLDPELVYSCAYFTGWDNDIATAQRDKLDMICRKLRLKPGEHFLDIGCGWGALVCHAAQHHGVHAHGVTLSEEQFAFAKDKVARLGLQDRVTIELRDYSTLQGSFDKIASIGMFEHVGSDNHPTYF